MPRLSRGRLTPEAALHFHDFRSSSVFHSIRGMDMEVLPDDGKEMVASHVVDLLASRDAHHLALYLKDRLTIGMANLKVIATERHDLFSEDKSFCLGGDVSWEDADLMRRQRHWNLRGGYLNLRERHCCC